MGDILTGSAKENHEIIGLECELQRIHYNLILRVQITLTPFKYLKSHKTSKEIKITPLHFGKANNTLHFKGEEI
jgi:hypothetical protein